MVDSLLSIAQIKEIEESPVITIFKNNFPTLSALSKFQGLKPPRGFKMASYMAHITASNIYTGVKEIKQFIFARRLDVK